MVNEAIMPVMLILSQFALVLSLFGLLVAVEPIIALFAVALFGGSYVLVFIVARRALTRIGDVVMSANGERFKSVHEAMTSIKDVKILGVEKTFLARFRDPTGQMAFAQSRGAVIGEAPRSILQALALAGMLVMILHLLVNRSSTLADIVPTLGIFAFAGLRLFPALQAIYRQLGSLKVTKPAVDELYLDMMETQAHAMPWPAERPPLPLHERLVLEGIRYTYPAASRPALKSLDLYHPGARHPRHRRRHRRRQDHAGRHHARPALARRRQPPRRRRTGHPGEPARLAEEHRLRAAADLADRQFGGRQHRVRHAARPDRHGQRGARRAHRQLHDFVQNELPDGYDTRVGDHGIRLSGGQRQRIGIARALYHDPDVLILDEATSALDNLTEKAVMDAVHNLGKAKTIIMIAHRLSTVQGCDSIIMIERGQIVARGSYAELLGKNAKFRAMAGVAAASRAGQAMTTSPWAAGPASSPATTGSSKSCSGRSRPRGCGSWLPREPRHRARRAGRAPHPLAGQGLLGGFELARGGGADGPPPGAAGGAAAADQAGLDGPRPRSPRRQVVQAPGPGRLYAALLARLADGALTLSEGTKPAVLAAYPVLAEAPHPCLAPGLSRRGAVAGSPGGGARRLRLDRGRTGLRLLRPAPALQGRGGSDPGLHGSAGSHGAGYCRRPAAGCRFAATLRGLAGDDPRIRLLLEDLAPAPFRACLGACDIVVAPFRRYLHSGSIVHALSAQRPVLTPATPFAASLAATLAAPDWLQLYEGPLTAATLAAARAPTARARPRSAGAPDGGAGG